MQGLAYRSGAQQKGERREEMEVWEWGAQTGLWVQRALAFGNGLNETAARW